MGSVSLKGILIGIEYKGTGLNTVDIVDIQYCPAGHRIYMSISSYQEQGTQNEEKTNRQCKVTHAHTEGFRKSPIDILSLHLTCSF